MEQVNCLGLNPTNHLLFSNTILFTYSGVDLVFFKVPTVYFFSQNSGFNISIPEGALVRVLITTLPKNLQDADPTKHGK